MESTITYEITNKLPVIVHGIHTEMQFIILPIKHISVLLGADNFLEHEIRTTSETPFSSNYTDDPRKKRN